MISKLQMLTYPMGLVCTGNFFVSCQEVRRKLYYSDTYRIVESIFAKLNYMQPSKCMKTQNKFCKETNDRKSREKM